MKVLRQVKMKVGHYEVGDQIKVKIGGEKYTATAIKRDEDGKALFLLDQILNEKRPVNENGGIEGGYEGSDLRKWLGSLSISVKRGVPGGFAEFENGDILTLLSKKEVFGDDEGNGRIEWMKDARHRIAIDADGDSRYWWLRGVANSTNFCDVSSGGYCSNNNASDVCGVRPAFTIYNP